MDGIKVPTVPGAYTLKSWKQLATIAPALVSGLAETSIVSILFPAISDSLGLTLTSLGIITGANKALSALCSPAWIWLARRWNRKGVLVVAAGVWGGWAIAAGFSSTFLQLLLLTSILGIGVGGLAPVITEILADLFDDRTRARAVGFMYGLVSLSVSLAGSAIGQLSTIQDGWRAGFWIGGTLNIVAGLMILLLFRDPGLGAAEPLGLQHSRPPGSGQSLGSIARVFRVPSFNIMLVSRLLSGHLVIMAFGTAFLTGSRHFPNNVAALVMAPFGLGYVMGSVGGAFAVDWLQSAWPRGGRVLFLQSAQFAFAIVAWLATQQDWINIETYMLFWLVMGSIQGMNPGVNRPIVMAVIPPELRGWAFVVMITIVEAIGWALYNLAAGWFGERYGLQSVFAVILVGVMAVNGLVLTLLYRTYGTDVDRLQPKHG